MSNELCPYCGNEPQPFGTLWVMCVTEDCSNRASAFTPEQWNRRFVCLDKNGDKVFADSDIMYTPPGQTGRHIRSYKCRVTELRPPRYGYGLVGDNDFTTHTFYPEEIELILVKEDA